MTLLYIETKHGYDGNGSPIDYYIVSTKKTAREFDYKEDVVEYIKHFLNYEWDNCIKLGKLISVLKETD